MLLLVLSHRHHVRLVDENVRRHQRRVGKEPGVDVFRVLCRFILELGHPGKFPELGVAGKAPSPVPRAGWHLALDKDDTLFADRRRRPAAKRSTPAPVF